MEQEGSAGERRWRVRVVVWGGLGVVLAVAGVWAGVDWRRTRDGFYVTSCANHFIQIRFALHNAAEEKPDFVLPATADTREALRETFRGTSEERREPWLVRSALACPETFRRDGSIGYVYVGDGIRLGDVEEKGILILFCPAESHRRSKEHCHGYVDQDGGICFKDNAEMSGEIRRAITRGERGEVNYSPRAMKALREELRKRERN